MTPLAFDTETALIRPGLLAPPMTCITWAMPPNEGPGILHVSECRAWLERFLSRREILFVGHFAAFDMAVICAEFPDLIPLVFAAYKAGRVTCTKKRQQLLDIAGGVFRGRPGEKGKWIVHDYTLDALSRRHLGQPMQKDGWRLEYANFRDVSIAQWPDRARELQERAAIKRANLVEYMSGDASPDEMKTLEIELRNLDAIIADVPEGVIRYPLDDAKTTLGVYLSQEQHAEYLKDQCRQAYADFVLYLSSAWGLRTDAAGVVALKGELEEAHAELEAELVEAGLVRKDGTRDMRATKRLMVETCRALGMPLRRTVAHTKCEAGDACEEHISLDSDACEAVVAADGEGDGSLARYAEFVTLGKMLANDVKMLEAGTVYPVHTRYDLAETGRITSSKPNITNLNTGKVKNKNNRAHQLRPGVRQAFFPRPGRVFAQADFPQLELYTLAQCCISWFGFSKLGEMLNDGIDPHLAFAAKLLGMPYADAAATKVGGKYPPHIDTMRRVGKAFNFGKPGGMGNAKFKTSARKMYGVELTDEQCVEYTAQWKAMLPEMGPHFGRVNAMFGDDVERASVETLFTERHRGGTTYCAACNNGFQALGADCAKAAACLIAEAEYAIPSSPLYGSRTVAFVHDELIVETNDGPGAHDAAFELARLMCEGANRYLPDVPILTSKMDPVLMRRWSKDAEQVWDANKRLIPWDIA